MVSADRLPDLLRDTLVALAPAVAHFLTGLVVLG